MILVIDTTALDKSAAAVTAIGNPTALTDLQQLTVGDNEPFDVTFTAGSAGAPAWAGTAGYICTVGIGVLDVDGLANYASAILATPKTAGWTGAMGLNTQQLYDNVKYWVGSAVDWSRFPTGTRTPYARPNGAWLAMQITITDPSGNVVTYADLRIFVRVRVMPTGAGTTGQSGLVGGVGGQVAATQGQTSQAVVFASVAGIGASFANACTGVSPSLIPASGAGILCWATNVSKNGFTANFASAIPATGWTLMFTAAGN